MSCSSHLEFCLFLFLLVPLKISLYFKPSRHHHQIKKNPIKMLSLLNPYYYCSSVHTCYSSTTRHTLPHAKRQEKPTKSLVKKKKATNEQL